MSRTRSKVTIAGKKAKRGDLKAGMHCKIMYPKGGGEAKTVDCQ